MDSQSAFLFTDLTESDANNFKNHAHLDNSDGFETADQKRRQRLQHITDFRFAFYLVSLNAQSKLWIRYLDEYSSWIMHTQCDLEKTNFQSTFAWISLSLRSLGKALCFSQFKLMIIIVKGCKRIKDEVVECKAWLRQK